MDACEFLARGSVDRRLDLGLLDAAPVAEGHRRDVAAREQRVEPRTSRPARTAPDTFQPDFSDAGSVGLVGADRPGRPAPRPAPALKDGHDAPLRVGAAAAAM